MATCCQNWILQPAQAYRTFVIVLCNWFKALRSWRFFLYFPSFLFRGWVALLRYRRLLRWHCSIHHRTLLTINVHWHIGKLDNNLLIFLVRKNVFLKRWFIFLGGLAQRCSKMMQKEQRRHLLYLHSNWPSNGKLVDFFFSVDHLLKVP